MPLAIWEEAYLVDRFFVKRPISAFVLTADEEVRESLRARMSEDKELTLLGDAAEANAGQEMILNLRPRMIFLDLHMPEAESFGLLRDMRRPPYVVFLIRSPIKALQAVEVEGVDCLVGRFSQERFASCIRRIGHYLQPDPARAVERFELLDHLCLRGHGNTRIAPASLVAALEVEGSFTRVHCLSGPSVLTSQPLDYYDELLPQPPFLRVDQNLIVNLQRVNSLSSGPNHLWLEGLSRPLRIGAGAVDRLREAGCAT